MVAVEGAGSHCDPAGVLPQWAWPCGDWGGALPWAVPLPSAGGRSSGRRAASLERVSDSCPLDCTSIPGFMLRDASCHVREGEENHSPSRRRPAGSLGTPFAAESVIQPGGANVASLARSNLTEEPSAGHSRLTSFGG